MKTILAILLFPMLVFSQVRFNDFTTNTAPFSLVSGTSLYVPTIYTTNLVTTNMSVTDFLFIGTAQVNYLTMLGSINQQGTAFTNYFMAETNSFAGDISANKLFGDGSGLTNIPVWATNVASGGTVPAGSLGLNGQANSILIWNGPFAEWQVVTNLSGTATNVINIAAGTLVSIVTNTSTLVTISADSQTNSEDILEIASPLTNAANILAITSQQTNAAQILAITAQQTNATEILAITAQQTNTASLEADLQIQARTNADSIITIASPLTNSFMQSVTNAAAYQALIATNGMGDEITNAAAYQANLATNGLITLADIPVQNLDQVSAVSGVATNRVSFSSLIATNGPTNNFTAIGPYGFGLTNANQYVSLGTNGSVAISGKITVNANASVFGTMSASGVFGVNQNNSTVGSFSNVQALTFTANRWIIATNGIYLTSFSTNQPFSTSTNMLLYCVNGTNQLITLHDASQNPWVVYRFVSTNGNGNFTVTNATGAQTIRDGTSLSLKNVGVGELGLFSDGANWQLASKFKTILANAQFSCTTNIALSTTARAVSFNSTDFNNSQGIALAVGTNSVWGHTSIWITNSGEYEFDPSVVETYDGNHTVTFWFKQNLTNIPNSATACKGANNTTKVVTVPFITSVSVPTQFEIWAISDDATGESFQFQAAGGAAPNDFPLSPSIICPVKRISDTRP